MRNTHFGDGFGFNGKFKGEVSLDSERNISRKRGTKGQENGIMIPGGDQAMREST